MSRSRFCLSPGRMDSMTTRSRSTPSAQLCLRPCSTLATQPAAFQQSIHLAELGDIQQQFYSRCDRSHGKRRLLRSRTALCRLRVSHRCRLHAAGDLHAASHRARHGHGRAANTPQTIQLSGFGIGPTPLVTLLPSLLTFFTPQGGSSSQNLVLTNNDTNPLPISSITIIGGGASAFTQTTCGTFVAAQSSCTIAVTFSPGIVSTHGISAPPPDIFKATVVVTDTAGSQTAQLVGTDPARSEHHPSHYPGDDHVL